MPYYDFHCPDCGYVVEEYRKIEDPLFPKPCPKCGRGPLKQIIGAPSVSLKGSGWAKDGYSNKKPTTEQLT